MNNLTQTDLCKNLGFLNLNDLFNYIHKSYCNEDKIQAFYTIKRLNKEELQLYKQFNTDVKRNII